MKPLNIPLLSSMNHPESATGKFRASAALVFASVRDLDDGVVFEALDSGAVPVVADFGGLGDLVDADRGVKIARTIGASPA